MSTKTLSRGWRRWLSAGALAALVITAATGCYGTWGVRSSFRQYIAGTANGTVVADQGATWLDGPGPASGPFQWTVQSADLDPVSETGWIQFSGKVSFEAHAYADDHLLDLEIWNPRLELDGDEGTLLADLNYRPYVSFNPGTLPELEAAVDMPFGDVDLSGFDWTLTNGSYSITDAPMTSNPAAMTLIGWDVFYGSTAIELDPLSVSFNAEVYAPNLVESPRITVSKTTDLDIGDEIVVWGAGFAPGSTIGTRPPFAGQPSGSYVIFGKFADTWKPSASAPSSSRTVIDQKWALPEPSFTALASNPQSVRIDEYGNFGAVIEIKGTSTAVGNYGIYSFPGSGAVNPAYELSTPLQINLPPAP